jgi:hypothetical protein
LFLASPRVRLKIDGYPADCSSFATSIVESNGLNPDWDEEVTFSLQLSSVDMLLLRVDSGKDEIGHSAVRVESLRNGFRSFLLRNKSESIIPRATVFCQIKLS